MTDTQLVVAYVGALGPLALVIALAVVECKREIVKGMARWQIGRMLTETQRAREKELREWRATW